MTSIEIIRPQSEDSKTSEKVHWSQKNTRNLLLSDKCCQRCIMDTSAPGIWFDESGTCSFCKLHDHLEREYPLNQIGQKKLSKILERTRYLGKNKKYDCVIGVSGGRDSTYLLWLAKTEWRLKPLAVHFNDGFDNPLAGENIKRAVQRLGVDLKTITSDWRESKAIRTAFLKASVPNLEIGTDLGIFSSLFGAAHQENIKTVFTAHSFRTEGISPLTWSYLDSRYLNSVVRRFEAIQLRPWKANNPGYSLSFLQLIYYVVLKKIKCITPMFFLPYERSRADIIIQKELGWVDPGAHYFDDLYQSLVSYVYRFKFGVDKRKFNYSALIRSGQMNRLTALERLKKPSEIEDPKVLDLCIKRLGLTQAEFEIFMSYPTKTFLDYPTYYPLIRFLRIPIWILSKLHMIPAATYVKLFNCH